MSQEIINYYLRSWPIIVRTGELGAECNAMPRTTVQRPRTNVNDVHTRTYASQKTFPFQQQYYRLAKKIGGRGSVIWGKVLVTIHPTAVHDRLKLVMKAYFNAQACRIWQT